MNKKETNETEKAEQDLPKTGAASQQDEVLSDVVASSGNETSPQEDGLSLEETKIAELEAEVERLSVQLSEEKDLFTRKLADMENYRKRLVRDKDAAVQFANERLISDLVEVLDDFDRALASTDAIEDLKAHRDGVRLIYKRLVDMLERNWGLKCMSGIIGKEFSPHDHEAIMMEESDQYTVETVLAELQKGYYLHDRVLRTAKVKVGKPL